ncbi:hypothetical protein LMG28727_04888 [Paraburkholderia kirstenboschensis]|uniref:hypothetical protein n=1 Tax=Paraburkholderia kirstenboschensis TaxID=1245436 RepID=UPI000AA6532D|nr:hypothetical protein [Paraburkholderia kirstenboschensis]CAD6548766.1 hypothetical protein LMG28727_04888 [Paraburkholderia kirstenboschensis]
MIDIQPAKLRPGVMKVRPAMPDKERWNRLTQRDYLLWAIGAIERVTYKATRIEDARGALYELNGMAGAW